MGLKLIEMAENCPITVCSFDYLFRIDKYDTGKLYYFFGFFENGPKPLRSNLVYTIHDNIKFRDIRGFKDRLSLDVHGFQLIKHATHISINSPDEKNLLKYFAEISTFLKKKE